MPPTAGDPALNGGRFEEVLAEILLAEERGEKPDLGRYTASFPDLEAPLRAYFRDREAFDRLAPARAGGGAAPTPADVRPTRAEEGQAAVESPPLGPGSRFSGYVIEEELGRGGMGVVYRALQLNPERRVALKVIRTDRLSSLTEEERRQWVERFRREARLVAGLGEHAGIVTLYEVGEHEDRPYFTMRLVAGGSLAGRLGSADAPGAADRRVRDQRANARLLVHAARAVDYAHRHGVLHRDLKPANILLDEQGLPLVTDYGLARRVDETGSLVTAGIEGTAPYIAPEQALDKPGAATTAADVYGLGAVLYELLTGRPPFRGKNDLETLIQVLNDPPIPPRKADPRLNRDLEAVCLRCLHKDPASRYPSAAALADDLESWLQGRPVAARRVGPLGRLAAWSRRQPYLAAAIVVMAAALLATAIISVLFGYTESRNAQTLSNALADAHKAGVVKDDAITKMNTAIADLEGEQRTNRRMTAGLLLDAGVQAAEQGDPALGLLRMTRAVEVAPQDDGDLQDAVRANLSAWAPTVSGLPDPLRHPGVVSAAGFTPDGDSLWTLSTGSVGPEAREVGGQKGMWWVFSPEIAGDDYMDGTGPSGIPTAASMFGPPPPRSPATPRGRPLLWDLAAAKQKPLTFPDDLRVLACSRDGRTVLAAKAPKDRIHPTAGLQFWDLAAGKGVGPPHDLLYNVKYAAFSGDGKTAVTAADRLVEFWDAATGQSRAITQGFTALRQAALSPDGAFLAVVTGSDSGRPRNSMIPTLNMDPTSDRRDTGQMEIYNFANGKLESNYVMGGVDPDAAVAVGPGGGPVLVSGSSGLHDGPTVRLWDRKSGQEHALPGVQGRVSFAAFSPDGKSLLIASLLGGSAESRELVQLWDVQARKPRGPSLQHAGGLLAAAFSPDSKTLATAGHNAGGQAAATFSRILDTVATARGAGTEGEAQLWDASAGRLIGRAFRCPQPVLTVAFSPDGKRLVTGGRDGGARVWDVGPSRQVVPVRQLDRVVASSADARLALVMEEKEGKTTLRLYDAEECKPCGESLPMPAQGRPAVLSPDGRFLLAAGDGDTAQLWDAHTGKAVGPPLTHYGEPVLAVGFSRDGREAHTEARSIGLGRGTELFRWRAETGEAIKPRLVTADGVRLATSPDGRTALIWVSEARVMILDVASGAMIGKEMPHVASPLTLLFSPDGRKVFTVGSRSGSWETGRLWDAATGEPVGKPLEHHGSIRAAAFSPDGRRVVTAGDDRKARVWDADTGDPISPELPHTAAVLAAAFSPDGRWVVTGCEDGTVRRWHAATGKPVGPPLPHPGAVPRLTFGRDGGTVVTCCANDAVRVWDAPAPLADPVDRVRLWSQVTTGLELEGDVPRSLSLEDWEQRREQLRGAAAP